MSNDIQATVQNIATMLPGYLDLDSTWTDIQNILDIIHVKVNDVAEDFNILANIELRLLFKPLIEFSRFIRQVTDSNSSLVKSLVDYYIGGVEYFCAFG